MATIKLNDIARAIYEAQKDASASERTQINENVVKFLKKNRMMKDSKRLLEKIKKIEDEEEGNLTATITTSRPLKEKSHAEIIHFLKHYYEAERVEAKNVIDESVIGGVKIEVGEDILDLTLANRINKLQAQLLRQ
jgi:F-type H+-transporting ATPase subunit delta